MKMKKALVLAVVLIGSWLAVRLITDPRPAPQQTEESARGLFPQEAEPRPVREVVGSSSVGRTSTAVPEKSGNEAPPVGGLELLVLDPDDQAVPNARIRYEHPDSGWQALGASDARGRFVWDAPEPGRLQPSKPGFFGEYTIASDGGGAGSKLRLRLHPEGVILGRIAIETLPSDPSSIVVVAFPSPMRAPQPGYLDRVLAGDARGAVAEVHPTGEFELRGLDPRMTYSIAAGGAGRVSKRVLEKVRPDEEPVVLALAYALGVRCLLRTADGHQLPESIDLDIGTSMRMINTDTNQGLGMMPTWLAPLLGVPLEVGSDPFETLLVYLSDLPIGVTGPIEFSSNLLRYEPVHESFYARQFEGVLPVHTVVMEPQDGVPAGRGRLEVAVLGDASTLTGSHDARRGPALFLVDDSGRQLQFRIHLDAMGECLLENVPVGRYEGHMAMPIGGLAWQPIVAEGRWIEILEGETPTRVEWGGAPAGGLRVAIQDQQGHPYNGPAVITMAALEGTEDYFTQGWNELDFDRGPYSIGSLQPGPYKIAIRFPLAYEEGPDRDHIVKVVDGAVVPLTMILE